MLDLLKNLNILYAEDDLEIRDSLYKTLSMLSNHVFLAKDGTEALTIFQKETVHIVILDYVMPLMNGYEVAKELRRENKHIPIIICSGYSDKEKLLNAIELNLIKYLEKPLSYDKLAQALTGAIKSLEYNNKLKVILSENIKYDYINKEILDTNGRIFQLTKHEVDFLELLLKKRSSLFTKDVVQDVVFGKNVESNTIRNMVYRLRKKIGEDIIVTVKDLGYLIK